DVLSELPKVSLVNASLKKLKFHLTQFDSVVKKRITPDALTEVCPILPNQEFVELPSEEELLSFIKELGYSSKCDMLYVIHTDQMHQHWRTFVVIINWCISGKTTRLAMLRESRAQILWGMYNEKNVDYVSLLWEDFMYQANNREISSARKEHMPYPRFT
ncbi:hypothetical protein Tco_0929838, partial [Tanacetum coccineum]